MQLSLPADGGALGNIPPMGPSDLRRNFLVKWQADTVAMSLMTKLATDALDAKFGSWTSWCASVGAGYLISIVR
ncbi:hypothetical protein [Burkholderia cenocepacia]|uniref:hypothetical protein n=1 Tax=Burkholderia cenocepacia TaxID=95486 RepID=UPI0013DED1DB|nr:hypothetical protein [Burkholderia cenocepacia]